MKLAESELILNPDGSIFHLHLRPGEVADNIILVGDPGRVKQVVRHFEKEEVSRSNREFYSVTGSYGGHRFTVVSTGIGTDNIDIVLNELDAVVNIDFGLREIKPEKKILNILRIGTSGSLQEEIPVDSFVYSLAGIGLDGLLNYYAWDPSPYEEAMLSEFLEHCKWPQRSTTPYLACGDESLRNALSRSCVTGITATAPGFYGPQGRILRLGMRIPAQNELFSQFRFDNYRLCNFEMETSALFGLGKLLGHRCGTVCAIIANRMRKEYSKDYKKTVDLLIEKSLSDWLNFVS